MQAVERFDNPFKQYVKVRADHTIDGRVIPLAFKPEAGAVVKIDKILDMRPAPALKAGGQGIRYVCRTGDELTYLFHDGDYWFVEQDDERGVQLCAGNFK